MSESRAIRCPFCRTINRAETVFCTRCKFDLHVHNAGARADSGSNTRRGRPGARDQQKFRPNPDAEGQAPSATFQCFRCNGFLGIRLSHSKVVYRCPVCRTEYHVTRVSDSPQVFVVIPDMAQVSSNAAGPPAGGRQRVSREVSAALTVLGLDEAATFDQVGCETKFLG